MIYLLYGEDTFSSKAKLEAIKRKFLEKHASDNLAVKQGHELTGADLEGIIFAQTLLGGNRLVILEDVLSGADITVKEKLAQVLAAPPLEVTIILHESESFDARQKLFKLVNQPGCAQKFDIPSPAILFRQVSRLAADKNVDISPTNLRYMLDRTEPDLWSINNELEKLTASSQGRPVLREDIDTLVTTSTKANVFDLIEKLIRNDLPAAHRILQTNLSQGEDEVRLLGALAYQLRNLIRVFDLAEQGLPLQAIIKQTGLPFFAAKRGFDSVESLDRCQLVEAYQKLINTDHQIKTGTSRPADALDLLVAQKI